MSFCYRRVRATDNETANYNKNNRAEALKRSMLSVMNSPNKTRYAQPIFWVSFVVVGKDRE